MKREVTSTKTEYHSLFSVLLLVGFALYNIVHIRKPDDAYVALLLALISAFFIYKFMHSGSLCYNEEFVYISRFRQEIAIPYSSVLGVKRELSSFTTIASDIQLGYKLRYETEGGRKKKFDFFVPMGKESAFEDFIKQLRSVNPIAKIEE